MDAPQRNPEYRVSSAAYGRPHYPGVDVGISGIVYSPASGSWSEQQSTTATSPEVGIGGTEVVISEPKNGAKVGVGKPDLPVP